MMKWFKVLIEWLESEAGAELYTLTELHLHFLMEVMFIQSRD